jgi:hypothetical protein
MTAAEIRERPIATNTGRDYEHELLGAISLFLREIAAQLADINAELSVRNMDMPGPGEV